MSDSFTVDTNALGQIPSILERARAVLDGIRVESLTAAAANAAAPGFGGGIDAFGRALDGFVGGGRHAIGRDIDKLRRSAAGYDGVERSVVGGMNAVSSSSSSHVGGGGR